MDATFLGLLDTNVQAIKGADNNKSANEKLLSTAKLLLDALDYSDDTLSVYGKLEMRKLFAAFSKIAQTACDFYQTSKGYLDPVSLNGEIGQTLQKTTDKLSDIIATIESIERNSADLLKMEKELNEKEAVYREKEKKISSLQEIYQTVTDEALTALDSEAAELNDKIEVNKQKKAELEDSINECRALFDTLSDAFVQINAEKKLIEENIIEKINERRCQVQDIFDAQSKDLNKIIDEIEDYKRQYAELDFTLQKVQESHKIYNLHFGENSKIINKLQEYGIPTIDNFISETQRFDDTVRKELEKYDSIIKSIIVAQEDANKKINDLQNKSTYPAAKQRGMLFS